jgi:opacity protein-like surface antigen
MKNISLVLLAAVTLAFAGLADAAPRKRTRNANRIGPYGMGGMGQSNWNGDHTPAEDALLASFQDPDLPAQNVSVGTDENDVGYNFTFGYRFLRYFAAELGLAQFGSVVSTGKGDMDLGTGFVPVTLKQSFSAGGPMVSALGILPLNDKFEVYGRLGYLFTSSKVEFASRIDGQNAGFASFRDTSQDMVLGVGAAYHFNQVYSARLEFQKLDELGDDSLQEDLNFLSVGVVVRF